VRVRIRSRYGNIVLGFLGVVYFLAAGATLVYYVAKNWGANGLTDFVLQAALLGAAGLGALFVLIALANLKSRDGSRAQSPSARGHRTAPADAS
jgi:hypothetical protein